MKNLKTLIIVLLLSISFGYGQEIISYSSVANPACSGIIANDPNLSGIGICRGSGININGGATYNSRDWTTNASIDANDYLEWTITPNASYELNLVNMDIRYDRSNNGPTMVDLQVNTGSGFVSIFTDAAVAAGGENNDAIDLSTYSNITSTITFRLFAFNATSAAGTFDIEERAATEKGIIINGTVDLICPTTVTWDGAIWSNVTGPTSSIAARISGNYNTSAATPSFTACSIIVDNLITLTVDEDYTIEVENDVTNNGTISVLTDGSFVQNNDSATFTNSGSGTSSVSKMSAFASDWLEYTYWSSPVAGETIGDALAPADANRRFRFRAENFEDNFAEMNNTGATIDMQDDEDDNGNSWLLVNAGDIMQAGVGYAATLSTTSFSLPPMATSVQINHEFFGAFNNGVIGVPIYRNDAVSSSAMSVSPDKNWNLIGNPYASAVSIPNFFAENVYDATLNPTGTLDGVIYYWSHQNPPLNTNNGNSQNNFSQSDYVMVNEMGATAANTTDNNGDGTVDANDTPDEFIPSGQGFFVTYNDAAPGTASSITSLDPGAIIMENTVTFRNSMRVSGNNDLFFRTTNQQNLANRLRLNMTTDTGVFSQILVGYKYGATNGLDAARYDAIRNRSVGNQTFFYSTIENSNDNYSIQGKAPESLTLDEVIPLGLYTTIDNPAIYSISISHFEGDFFNTNTIYLKDNYTSVIHDLNASDYSFTSASGEFRDRFEIVFNSNSLSVDSFNIDASNLNIVELQDDNVQFSIPGSVSIKSVRIIDILGRELYDFRGSENTEVYNLSKLSSAPYIAQVTLSNGKKISKKAIKK